MLIGELARRTGLSRDTIRYYERFGLIRARERRDNSYKEYPEEAVAVLGALLEGKQLGFSLREMQEIIGWFTSSKLECGRIEPVIREKLADIDDRLARLRAMRERLSKAAAMCKRNPGRQSCTVLEKLFAERTAGTRSAARKTERS